MLIQYQIGTDPVNPQCADLARPLPRAGAYHSDMAIPRIRKGARGHLYIAEHMEAKGLSDERLAGRIGVARETVTRWRNQQHRLNPDKIAQIADALDLEPRELFSPPGSPSLDAMLKNAPEGVRQQAFAVIAALAKTGT